MAENRRSVTDLLTIFSDGQPQGSINPEDVRDFVVSASVLDTTRIIKQESDFPAPILAPDGNMRIPLEISVDYIFDIDQLTIATPFLMPSRLLGFERVRFQSLTNTTMNYTGTIPLFFGRNQGPFETDKVDYVGIPANNTICFDMIAASGVVALTLFNTAFVMIDVGLTEGFAINGFRVGFFDIIGPFRAHNSNRCFIESLVLDTQAPPSDFPVACIITGGLPVTGYGFNNIVAGSISGGQSYFAIDPGAVFNQVLLTGIPFDGTGGTFFELVLTGSLDSFADISVLINSLGPLTYESDGSGNVLVTDVGHPVYPGITVTHFLDPTYTGTWTVLRVLGNDQHVISAPYSGDSVGGSGIYVGIGTRITTSAPHKLTEHRTTDITGTVNYDGAGLEVLNPTTSTFDIGTPFVVDDGMVGIYTTNSLTQADIKVLATNNGALPDSKQTGEVDLPIAEVNIPADGGSFVPIGGSNWVSANTEEFTTSSAGELIYVGVNSATFTVIGTATVERSGGSSALLAMRIAKEGFTIPSSQGSTQNSTPTQITCIAIVELAPNEKVSLHVRNLENNDTIDVSVSTLVASGA